MQVSDTNIQISSFKHLIAKIDELTPFIFYIKYRFFSSERSNLSWIHGLSKTEVNDYISLYLSTKIELKHLIEREDNLKLKSRLYAEYQKLPEIKINDYIPDRFSELFIPFSKIRKTRKFNNQLKEIRLIFQNVINLIENKEWLEF